MASEVAEIVRISPLNQFEPIMEHLDKELANNQETLNLDQFTAVIDKM